MSGCHCFTVCFLNICFKQHSFRAFGCSRVQVMGQTVVVVQSHGPILTLICLVDVVDGQLEGCGGKGLWNSIACVSSICCSRHSCILLQSGQSRCVGSVVCDGDVSTSIQATSCWDTLYVVGHGIDRSDRTALGNV